MSLKKDYCVLKRTGVYDFGRKKSGEEDVEFLIDNQMLMSWPSVSQTRFVLVVDDLHQR